MIKLSKITDYAVVILAYMSRNDKLLSASDISNYTSLPEPTVSKILKLLSKSSIIKSVRGASGGYVMLKKESDITANDIITAIEGPIALTSCVDGSKNDPCKTINICPLSNGWQKINDAITDALSTVTLEELVSYEEAK